MRGCSVVAKRFGKASKLQNYAVVEARLANERQKHRPANEVDPSNAKMRFGQAAALFVEKTNNNREPHTSDPQLRFGHW
jgi:hypothetical protein